MLHSFSPSDSLLGVSSLLGSWTIVTIGEGGVSLNFSLASCSSWDIGRIYTCCLYCVIIKTYPKSLDSFQLAVRAVSLYALY